MRNETTLNTLKRQLELNCGDTLAAAKAAGVSLVFVNQWRRDDPEVHEALLEAERVGTQGLVSAAIQRGVHGVPEDVWYKGQIVGQKINYSDSLLTTLLKAKVDDFKKENESGGVNVQVNVANLMPRATSYEQWLAMKDQTLNKALPAPTDADRDASLEALGRIMTQPPADVIDAEYAEVPANPFAGIDL